MLRVVNFLKLLSILLFLIILLTVYAYLPIMVALEPGGGGFEAHKETFFYFSVSVFVLVNVSFLGFQKLFEGNIKNPGLRAWVRSAGFVINIYLTLIIGFIGVMNNTGHLDPSGFAYLNYMGPFLVFSWAVGLFYIIYKKA